MTGRVWFAAAAAVALVAMPGAALAAPSEHAAAPLCQGHRATIVVSGNHRAIRGTSHSDVIVATGIGDTITAGAGNDILCAGYAKAIDTGAGNDSATFWGGAVVHGGGGNDRLTQLSSRARKECGNPRIYGDAGNDTITLGCGNGKAYGGAGKNVIKIASAGGSASAVATPTPASAVATPGPSTGGPTTGSSNSTGGLIVHLYFDWSQGYTYPPARIMDKGPGQPTDTYEYDPVVTLPAGATVTAWSLSFGDETPVLTGTGPVPASFPHVYDETGTFDGVLTVTDSLGDVAADHYGVVVSPFPALGPIGVTVDPDTMLATLDLTRTAPGLQIGGLELNWGDGTPTDSRFGPVMAPAHTYLDPDTYVVSVGLQLSANQAFLGTATEKVPVDLSNGHPPATVLLPSIDWQGNVGSPAYPWNGVYYGNTASPITFTTAHNPGICQPV